MNKIQTVLYIIIFNIDTLFFEWILLGRDVNGTLRTEGHYFRSIQLERRRYSWYTQFLGTWHCTIKIKKQYYSAIMYTCNVFTIHVTVKLQLFSPPSLNLALREHATPKRDLVERTKA